MSETIKQKIERARKAFDEISDYTQEQVDKLIYEERRERCSFLGVPEGQEVSWYHQS